MVTKLQNLSSRNKLSLAVSLISFLFLFPGIFLSMLTVSTKGSINANIPHVEKNFIGIPSVKGTDTKHIPIKVFDTSRSIIKTIHDLWNDQYYFVSSMILLFSIIIPLIKELLMSSLFFVKKSAARKKIYHFLMAIGKWSMNDVFIVAVFLAYLSTGATQTDNVKNVALMGYTVKVDVIAGMQAELHIGFWCFLIYCLLSLIALQLFEPDRL